MPRREPPGTVATNRRARHDYEILETVEAGIVLLGLGVVASALASLLALRKYVRI